MVFFRQPLLEEGPEKDDHKQYAREINAYFQGRQFQQAETKIEVPFRFNMFGGDHRIGGYAHGRGEPEGRDGEDVEQAGADEQFDIGDERSRAARFKRLGMPLDETAKDK